MGHGSLRVDGGTRSGRAARPGQIVHGGTGIEFQRWRRGEGAEPSYVAPNAPGGVAVDYSLPKKLEADAAQKKLEQTPVKIEVHDAQGRLIATRYGESKYGINRYVWDMRYDGPTETDFEQPALEGKAPDWARGLQGPEVLPGAYTISVTAAGHTESVQAHVIADPNLPPALDAQRQTLQMALAARSQADAFNRMLNRISAMQTQLEQYQTAVAKQAMSGDPSQQAQARSEEALVAQAKSLAKELSTLKDSAYEPKVQHKVMEDELHQLTDLHGAAEAMASAFGDLGTQAPTPPLVEIQHEVTAKLTAKIAEYNALLGGDIAAYNQAAYAAGAPTLAAGKPIEVAAPPTIG